MAREPISAGGCRRVLRQILEDTLPIRNGADSLVQFLLAQGSVSPSQVEECRGMLSAGRRAGAGLRLEHVLLRKGYLTVERYLEALDSAPGGEGPPRGSLSPGDRLGRYRLERVIGRGGMGVVYLAHDTQLRRNVAVKTLHMDDGSPSAVSRFHREAAIGAQLHHSNIVQVYEVGTAEPSPGERVHFIAMEYVEGRTFATLSAEGGVSREERLRLMEEIARAVGYAHSKGVVHRDVKPSNVMIEQSGRVILMDFGLARAEAFASKITRSDALIGTPQYMSPEQVGGTPDEIDARSDVHALGAMLYEVLTGEVPFRSKSASELYHQILREDPPRPSSFDRAIEPDLDVICLKALAKEKSRRYDDGTAFAEDLARFRRGEPIHARPASWLYRVRRGFGRRWRSLALTGAALALAGAGVLWSMSLVERNREFHRSRAEADRAFSAGDWSGALARYERALQARKDAVLEGRAAECRTRISAERALTERKIEDARRYRLLQEEKLGPLRERIREARLYSYIADVDPRGRIAVVERALAELETLVQDPDLAGYAEPWVLLGEGWEFVGNIDAAVRALKRAESLGAEDSLFARPLGRLYAERCLDLLRHAGGKQCGSTHEAVKRWGAEAIRYLERGSAEGAGSREIDRLVSRACIALAREDLCEAQRICRLGLERLPKEIGREEFLYLEAMVDAEASFRLLAEALKIRPHYPRAYLVRANRCIRAGNEAAALADLDRAVYLNPGSSQARIERGLLHAKRRSWDPALEDLNEAIRLRPDFDHLRSHRGMILASKGEFDRAIEDCDHAIRADSTDGYAYFVRGEARRVKQDFAGALADFTRAIELETALDGVYRQRGFVKLQLGDPSAAILDLNEAIRIAPRDAEAHSIRGAAYDRIGKLQEAERDLDESIRLRPDAWRTIFERANLRWRKNDLEGAVADYTRVIELDPRNAAAYFNRGQVRVIQQKPDLAMDDFSSAIARDPKHADAYCRRAYVKSLKADTAGAVEDYRRALEVAPPDWPFREEVSRWLAEHGR